MNSHHIISLSFILFLAFSNPLTAVDQKVLDSNGDPLQPGSEYYAKYFKSPEGGPIIAERGCPKSVVHDPQTNGLPLSIRPKDNGSDIVESAYVYIEFTEGVGSDCPYYNTTMWTINQGGGFPGTTIITVGGNNRTAQGQFASRFSEFQIVSFRESEFQIVKSGSAYQFIYADRVIVNLGSSLGLDSSLEPYQIVFLKKSASANVI